MIFFPMTSAAVEMHKRKEVKFVHDVRPKYCNTYSRTNTEQCYQTNHYVTIANARTLLYPIIKQQMRNKRMKYKNKKKMIKMECYSNQFVKNGECRTNTAAHKGYEINVMTQCLSEKTSLINY